MSATQALTLSAYGHSWAGGAGATRRDRGFAALTARDLRLRHDDRAQSGSLSTETARLVTSNPPPPAGVFVLMTGLNDARRNGPSAGGRRMYGDALAVILRALRQSNPDAPVLALEQPYISDYAGYEPFHRASAAVIGAYNATLRLVASRHRTVVVVPIDGWTIDTMVSVDGVHPNDTGHRHLAQAVVRACRQSRRYTDQQAPSGSAASELRSAGRISR